MKNPRKVFISYSYDDDDHKKWVLNLANKLEKYRDFHITLDQYDLSPFDEKNLFMEKAISESDIIIVVATENYVQKANKRKGGVGTETSMAAARHFSEIDKNGRSNIIAITKSNKYTVLPTYLNNVKIRLNFDTGDFLENFEQLINVLSGNYLVSRPQKTLSINSVSKAFKTADKILSVNHKDRKKIEYQNQEKIKYEFWECMNPSKDYFLTFFPTSNLVDSINHYISNTKEIPSEITILKVKDSNTGEKTFQKILQEKSPKIYEYSYSSYFWNFCLETSFKEKKDLSNELYYIPQDLYDYSTEETLGNTIENSFISDFLINDNTSPILLLLGTAGKGKTTLIENIIDNIDADKEKKCIYISSEDFKAHYIGNENVLNEISCIYDLYNNYIRVNNDLYHLDENIFEVGISNGNIIIIIDGLDEIITLYQDKFILEDFLDSLIKLNRDFGKSKIIISSREYYWKESEILKRDDIFTILLKGFTDTNIKNYLILRTKYLENSAPDFYDYKKIDQFKSLVNQYITEIKDFTKNETISPFIVDIICTSTEIQQYSELDNLDITNEYTYPCNDKTMDKVLFAILNREIKRQNFYTLKSKDLVDILIDFTIYNGEVFSYSAFQEMIELRYPTIYKGLIESLKFSQLLDIKKTQVSFRYGILINHFTYLYLLRIFTDFHETETIRYSSLAKLFKGESPIFNEVIYYYDSNERKEEFLLNAQKIIQYLLKMYKQKSTKESDLIQIERCISSIIHILLKINEPTSMTPHERINLIKKLYQVKDSKIEYLFIFNEFYNLDFTNLEVWHSKFVKFENFLHSNFSNSKFYYTVCKEIKASSSLKKSFSNIVFDETCELFGLLDELTDNNEEKMSKSIEFIFNKFYKKEFKDFTMPKKNTDLEFTKYLPILLEYGFIIIIDIKNTYSTYRVHEIKKPSIKKFLTQNTKDYSIKALLKKMENLV